MYQNVHLVLKPRRLLASVHSFQEVESSDRGAWRDRTCIVLFQGRRTNQKTTQASKQVRSVYQLNTTLCLSSSTNISFRQILYLFFSVMHLQSNKHKSLNKRTWPLPIQSDMILLCNIIKVPTGSSTLKWHFVQDAFTCISNGYPWYESS